MDFKNITIAGSGVLGYQIAFQTAFHGYHVTVYDINDDVLKKAAAKFDILAQAFEKDLHASKEQLASTFDRLSYSSDLAAAVAKADLLIEAVPENPAIKIGFYQELAKVAPEKTIFATNSSTLLPSQFAQETGRPEKFLALHFANEIWKHNTAEIMGHPGTDKAVFEQVVNFAKSIGMVALPLHKEQPGYIVNSLLVPLLSAATDLLVNGILDIVGITTAYNINKMSAEATNDPLKIKTVAYLKEHFIDKNKLGVATGEGFYTYPNPAYQSPDFLK